jgi:hypothetical protein
MSATPDPVIVCDVAALASGDLGTVDALARLTLEARRFGLELRLAGVPRELGELIAFAGLAEVLLSVDSGRQPEQREQARGIEEERQLGGGAT